MYFCYFFSVIDEQPAILEELLQFVAEENASPLFLKPMVTIYLDMS